MEATTKAKAMDLGETKTVQTRHGELRYCRNWDWEGGILMHNARTIDTYIRLRKEEPEASLGFFFAFSKEQFEKGIATLRESGKLCEGGTVYDAGAGLFGTADGLDAMDTFYRERNERMARECDPQEVYFEEYNNHECMITRNDEKAFAKVVDIFGEDVAATVMRLDW